MKQFLIVKTSALGDIIQSFDVLDLFQGAPVDWVVDKRFAAVVEAHPLIRSVFAFDRTHLFSPSFFSHLRQIKYDALFDLQGNCKSGLFTLLSRSREKIGFGRKTVREWPNLLATTKRYEIPALLSTRDGYIQLVQAYLQVPLRKKQNLRLRISEQEQERIQKILSLKELQAKPRVMICLNSNWINKQLSFKTALSFLKAVRDSLQCSFLFMWGSGKERENSLILQESFSDCSAVIDKMPLPTWQNLMAEVELVLAVDSGALHLCGTTSTPSFSIFGPTSSLLFKPLGTHHGTIQGSCPYHQKFIKLCPHLRTCPTGACTREMNPKMLFESFSAWYRGLNHRP